MQKIIDLTSRINRWNMMGHSLLPPLQLVIITGKGYQERVQHIVSLFMAEELQISGEGQGSGERIYIMRGGAYGKIHVIQGLSDPEIKDTQFRARKKIVQKYRRQRYLLFLVFSPQDHKQLSKNHHELVQFGLVRNIDTIIHCTPLYSDAKLLHQLLSKYENSFKYDLVTNYRIMRQQQKESEQQSKRYIEWKKVMDGKVNPTTYSLLSFRQYSESMRSSFTGTYSTSSHYEMLGMGKSICWKVMQLLHAFWQIQSDILFKQVDSFPLSYIEQQYKMSDHYSIGGFLPATCFKAIFAPPLYELRNTLMSTIQNIKYLILRHVEIALEFVFMHANVRDEFVGRELENVEAICEKFVEEVGHSLESQIQYIHASPEDFWNYRQLNSSFYSPDQQVYIEIKYIGKAYVRKVYQSIKDAVPRLIGQGLLKRIEKYIGQDSINTFIEVTRSKQFQIVMSPQELKKYETNLQTLKQLDSLIIFFSLRVNASFMIKNFHEKKQKEWDRMFGRSQKIEIKVKNIQVEEKGGVLNWMKKIFQKNKNTERRRANSGEKNVQKPAEKQENKMMKQQNQKNFVLNQKNWLLIINTGRQVSHQRIKQSARHGFPPKFRSSIWMYLATKGKPKSPKLKTLLKEPSQQTTIKQIQKDLPRTAPRQLFQYSMKSSLKNVLIGYSIHDKEIGYTQGMNFITAVILTTLISYGQKASPLVDNRINYEQVQEKAFCILKHIMQECGVRKLMTIQPQMLADLSLRLSDRITELSPQMSALIEQTPFTCQMIFSSPLISCLSNVTTNLTLMRRFLDILITHDFFIVYRIIGQFVAHCEFMRERLNPDNLYDFLKNKMYDEVYGIVGDEGLTRMFGNL